MSEAPDNLIKDKMSESADENAPLISLRQLKLVNIGIQCGKDKGRVSYILFLPFLSFFSKSGSATMTICS